MQLASIRSCRLPVLFLVKPIISAQAPSAMTYPACASAINSIKSERSIFSNETSPHVRFTYRISRAILCLELADNLFDNSLNTPEITTQELSLAAFLELLDFEGGV